jgi:hypothetical protein
VAAGREGAACGKLITDAATANQTAALVYGAMER